MRLDTTGLNLTEIAYKWSTFPKIEVSSYANRDDRRHFVVRPNSFTQDSYYDI